MDIKDLIDNLDPKNAAQVKALQEALQAKGYAVKPDGVMGGDTSAAIAKWKEDAKNDRDATLRAKELEDQAKDRSWQNQAIQAAKWSTVPAGIGYGMSQAGKIEKRQLGTLAAQQAGQVPNAPMGWSSPRRFAGRFAPYAGQGALFTAEGLALRELLPQHIESKAGQEVARAAGSGLIGAGVGMTGKGLVNAFTPQGLQAPMGAPPLPGAPPGGPQLPGGPAAPQLPPSRPLTSLPTPPAAPDTPPPPPAAPPEPPKPSFKTGVEARRYAESKGVKLPTKLSAAEAIARAEQLKSTVDQTQAGSRAARLGKGGKALLPLTIGSLAYDAASSDAEARGASPDEAMQQGLVEGAAAGGGTAAGAYGLGKILEKAPTFGRALAGGSAMMAPMLAGDMSDMSSEEVNQGRNWMARNLPFLAVGPGMRQAYDMAQVPQRKPPMAPMGFGAPY